MASQNTPSVGPTGGSGTPLGPITIPGGGIVVVAGVIWTLIWIVSYYAYGRNLPYREEWAARERELRAEYEAERATK
jgi:hypothetical protein